MRRDDLLEKIDEAIRRGHIGHQRGVRRGKRHIQYPLEWRTWGRKVFKPLVILRAAFQRPRQSDLIRVLKVTARG